MTFSTRTWNVVGALVGCFVIAWIYLTFFGLPPEPAAHGVLPRAWQLFEWPIQKVLQDVAASLTG